MLQFCVSGSLCLVTWGKHEEKMEADHLRAPTEETSSGVLVPVAIR